MKLDWGHSIAIAMAIFILIMAQFMVRAYHHQEALVAEDYYARELRYQEQIDKLGNAAALGEAVRFDVRPGEVVLTFPEVVRHGAITGELFLMRPSDARADHRTAVRADSAGRFVLDTRGMLKGAYTVHLEWSSGGQDHLTEDRLHLP